MQIEVEVKGQQIKRLNSPGSVEDTLNYLTCHFTFDGEEWDNTVKTAHFQNYATKKIYSALLTEGNTCVVPWEALTDQGFVKFSVAGERENYRITTDTESFYNGETVYGGNPSEPPTPDQYDQLIALAQETKEIAESVREDADAGKFDGEPGKPGDPGKDGVSPSAKVEQTDDGAVITVTDATGTTKAKLKNGKDGNPGQDATDEQVRTAVEAYMEEHPVQVDTEDIIKLAIKEEASGEVPVVIADSAEMGVQDLEMQGWTEQDSYEGNQLLHINIPEQGLTNNGITIVPNSYGGFRATGSAGEKLVSIRIAKVTLNAGTYTLSGGDGNANSYRYRIRALKYGDEGLNGDAYDGANSSTQTLATDNLTSGIYFQVPIGVTLDDDVYPMLNEGSTALPWEPYTGGAPSPSPEYPQEIVSAGKYDEGTGKYQYKVKLTGKNLFDAEYFRTTLNWKRPTDGNSYPYIPIYIGKGNRITISTDGTLSEGLGFYCAIARTNKNTYIDVYTWIYFSDNAGLIKTNVSFTVVEDDYIYLALNKGTGNVEKFLNAFTNFQIEISAQKTEYQPYKEQTVTLTSDRPLTKWDRLEKRNGVWGWVYGSAEIVCDGSEDEAWRLYRNNSFNQFYINIDTVEHLSNEKNAYCKKFRPAVIADRETEKEIIYTANGAIAVSTELTTELDAWKTWIQSNPITVLYRSIEETFVPLSESEQEQMNELCTYYPTTVLSNDQECDMALTYIADTKAYIDNKISAIQAAIVNAI